MMNRAENRVVANAKHMAAAAIAALTMLTASGAAQAKDDDLKQCGPATLHGLYIFHASGFNIVGGVLYPGCFLVLGYTLGRTVPGIDNYVLPVVTVIAIAFALPAFVHHRRSAAHEELPIASLLVGYQRMDAVPRVPPQVVTLW